MGTGTHPHPYIATGSRQRATGNQQPVDGPLGQCVLFGGRGGGMHGVTYAHTFHRASLCRLWLLSQPTLGGAQSTGRPTCGGQRAQADKPAALSISSRMRRAKGRPAVGEGRKATCA